MAENLQSVTAERDALRAENENLRGQLSAASATQPGTAAPVQHRFILSEGHRQELATTGAANIDGRMMTTEEVRAALGEDQKGVKIPDVDPASALTVQPRPPRAAVAGVDFVYPSVEPGRIDPAVAGTPGINGPAADRRPNK